MDSKKKEARAGREEKRGLKTFTFMGNGRESSHAKEGEKRRGHALEGRKPT